MKLSRVEYEFFEFEEPLAASAALDRQLRLHFSDAPTLYISWTAKRQYGPDSPYYSIDFSEEPYCTDTAPVVVDASRTENWAGLIGHDVEISYLDADYQALSISNGNHILYCSAQEEDVVRISRVSPLEDGQHTSPGMYRVFCRTGKLIVLGYVEITLGLLTVLLSIGLMLESSIVSESHRYGDDLLPAFLGASFGALLAFSGAICLNRRRFWILAHLPLALYGAATVFIFSQT